MELGPIQKQWLQSLREHPERQLKFQLGRQKEDGIYKACCLGELGLIAKICHWDNDNLNDETGALSNLQTFEKVGLRSQWGMAQIGSTKPPLAALNDEHMTWPEIADYVEKNPELYFTRPV